jgi:hypothetical protein
MKMAEGPQRRVHRNTCQEDGANAANETERDKAGDMRVASISAMEAASDDGGSAA